MRRYKSAAESVYIIRDGSAAVGSEENYSNAMWYYKSEESGR